MELNHEPCDCMSCKAGPKADSQIAESFLGDEVLIQKQNIDKVTKVVLLRVQAGTWDS